MIYTVVGLLELGGCLDIGILLVCTSCVSSFFSSLVYVCVCDDLCCFPSDVCYFAQGNSTCLLVAGSAVWKRAQY